MTCGQLISCSETISSKNSIKVAAWKLFPFVFSKNQAQPLLENEIFETI